MTTTLRRLALALAVWVASAAGGRGEMFAVEGSNSATVQLYAGNGMAAGSLALGTSTTAQPALAFDGFGNLFGLGISSGPGVATQAGIFQLPHGGSSFQYLANAPSAGALVTSPLGGFAVEASNGTTVQFIGGNGALLGSLALGNTPTSQPALAFDASGNLFGLGSASGSGPTQVGVFELARGAPSFQFLANAPSSGALAVSPLGGFAVQASNSTTVQFYSSSGASLGNVALGDTPTSQPALAFDVLGNLFGLGSSSGSGATRVGIFELSRGGASFQYVANAPSAGAIAVNSGLAGNPVSEPSSLALAAIIGLGGLSFAWRRQRRTIA